MTNKLAITSCAIALLGFMLSAQPGAAVGFDAGSNALALVTKLRGNDPFVAQANGWLRIRGVPEPGIDSADEIAAHKRALVELHARGFHTCVLLIKPAASWATGVRALPQSRLPLDLSESFEWARRLGRAYVGLVDAWEVDNEPDIGFLAENPETYAAFFKAVSLGIRRGEHQSQVRDGKSLAIREIWSQDTAGSRPPLSSTSSLILMAPLALPPGPYCERLVANELLSYTDGFNYHFYGYAEDFTNVYEQFRDTVERVRDLEERSGELEFRSGKGATGARLVKKDLPVFLTEFGYGTLSEVAASTVEGRARQWRWFRDVHSQITRLQIEGAMAFYLPPYLEYGMQEFGLAVKPRAAVSPPVAGREQGWTAGGLKFTPQEFGVGQAEPWMRQIGARVGLNEASPALAWLLAEGKSVAPSLAWQSTSRPPSSIVIDFVAQRGMLAVKQCQGYFLTGAGEDSCTGLGELRIFNFSDFAVSGRLELGDVAQSTIPENAAISIPPGRMRLVLVRLRLKTEDMRPHEWIVRFTPSDAGSQSSVFATLLYGDASRLARRVLANLAEGEPGAQNSKIADARPITREEPPEHPAGRWRLSKGVEVAERDGIWRFSVTGFPTEPLRPAIAELVLPDGFQMAEGGLLELDYRLAARANGDCSPAVEPHAPVAMASAKRESLGIYWRTANGNLFTVWRPPPATFEWRRYVQAKSSFTMAFFGRAKLPWRFRENRPVALVFQFGPNFLPAVFEVKNAVVTEYTR